MATFPKNKFKDISAVNSEFVKQNSHDRKQRGRPKKSDSTKRTKGFMLYLTQDEYAELERVAFENCDSISQYIREKVFKKA